MVNTEYCSIHPESDDYPHNGARLWDESNVRNLSVLCDHVHEHGALAGVELWFEAAHAANHETRMPARGVSPIQSDEYFLQSCWEMDKDEIRGVQQFYVAAAKRARDAGFDVVNVYGGHFRAIPHQFLVPFCNKRTDEYGSSFENRARFWTECLELVCEAVGDDCAIAARFGFDGVREDQIISVQEDAARFIAHADHLVDAWDFQIGTISNAEEDSTPSRFRKEDAHADLVHGKAAHQATGDRNRVIREPLTLMVAAIQSGQLDIIGVARPSIADPFLSRKIEEGRLDNIRECTGCKICPATVWGVGSRLDERPSENRIREAIGLEGVELFVVACPKDVTIYEEAIKSAGSDSRLTLREVTELVEEAALVKGAA